MDDFERDARARVGSVVGRRWQLVSLLGIGGTAAVYAVRDASTGQEAALKLLHPEVNAVPEAQKRFIREVAINNELLSRGATGLVQVLETGVDPSGLAFAVMERLAGEELNDHLRRVGRMPVDQVLRIADDALQVLEVAHAAGIVHRDLKPENLFLDASGRLRVLDFGLARVLEAVPDTIDLPDKTRTKSGIILGTAAYMSPEQAIGVLSEIDGRTDIYSLAATLFRALTGRTVHGTLPLTQQVVAAATQPAEPIRTYAPELPAQIAEAIDRGLAFRKEDRFATATELRQALTASREGTSAAVAIGGLGSGAQAKQGPSNMGLWILIGLGGVMLLIAAFVATVTLFG